MKIAVIIPSTTNKREWTCMKETYLYNSVRSFIEKYNPNYEYKFYIGVDIGDKIYGIQNEKNKIYELCRSYRNINIQFYPLNIKKGYVTAIWNELYKKAIQEHHDYYYATGDDIMYCSDGWIDRHIHELKKTNGLGTVGCYNGNGRIITQFMVTKKHWDIFGFMFNPKIVNWFCDDHLNELYSKNLL